MPLLQERTISRKRPATDRIENVEDARRIKNARVLDTTKEKLTDDAIEEVNLFLFLLLLSAYVKLFIFTLQFLIFVFCVV